MSDLVVTIPEDHEPERRYIVQVLLDELLGFPTRIQLGGRDWVIAVGDKRLVVENALQLRDLPERTHEVVSAFSSRPLVGLFGTADVTVGPAEIRCRSDLFAAAFFMLSRWEERVNPTRDAHDRFPATASLAMRCGFLHRPIVNEYIEWLEAALRTLGYTHPRRRRTFSIELSHDVDHPIRWSWKAAVTTVAGDLLRRRAPLTALRNTRSIAMSRLGVAKDPYDTFDWLMEVSERAGVVSQFNFLSGGETEHDPRHEYDSPRIRRLIRSIVDRGHRVGFHPSYLASGDDAIFSRELARLRAMSPAPITSGRNHYLRFSAPRSWQVWERHGLAVDSTVGYADHEGFRAGTCYRYPVFDLVERRTLKLVEQPLIVMDTTLVGYRRLAASDVADVLNRLRSTVASYGGELTLLWHNSNLGVDPWLPYRAVYRDFVLQGKVTS